MQKTIDILLPKLGESIVSATVVKWCKKVGDTVQKDEALVEVSTDKINSEIPSPVTGVLLEISISEGVELQVGERLGILSTQEGATLHQTAPKESLASSSSVGNSDFLSPALLRRAQEKGISLEELRTLKGTGQGGRLTRLDLEQHLSRQDRSIPPMAVPGGQDVERMEMSGMRKAIAENMVRSFYEAPHATLVTEVDVTEIMKFIQKEKNHFTAKYGCKLTVTSFIAHAITKALAEFPIINSSLDQDTILLKKFVNLGIAVSVEQGLMVPVVRNCQRLSVTALAQAIHELSHKARDNKLTPDDITGGTITLTNFGMTGIQIGIPIIRYPEVAIIGIGAIYKRVVPLEDDVLAIRQMLHLSLTFDHRVLDGMYGCGFLSGVQKHIETNLKID